MVISMPENTVYFDASAEFAQWQINDRLLRLIEEVDKPYSSVSVVCIGTDRSTGDSYGPLTGHMLSRLSIFDFKLYGTFENPVHALSLPQTLEQIDLAHSLVIAVDACVGNADFVGYIGLGREPVRPGSGLGKQLPPVGDIAVTGIVAMNGVAPFIMLQNASLGLVYRMAEKTFCAIQYCLYKLQYGSVPLPLHTERSRAETPVLRRLPSLL